MLVVVLAGGYGSGASGILRAMREARRAAAVDLVEKVVWGKDFRVVLVSDDPVVLDSARSLGCIEWDSSCEEFVWLQVVQDVVRTYARPEEGVAVMGGCAAPLLQVQELEAAAHSVTDGEVWQNNRLSPDLILWKPAQAAFLVRDCHTDNQFGFALESQAGLVVKYLQRSLGFGFDLDTPVDAVLAASRAECGPRLREVVSDWNLWGRVQAVRTVLARPYPDVALIGRVHPVEAERFGQGAGVRLRVFSEERGMKALGRVERGEVRSLLGAMVEAVGWQQFFAVLAEQVECVLFDTRVVLEHFGVRVGEEERFAVDLGLLEEVRDPFLRELTSAVAACKVPVLMGGQSLVGGGLRLWVE
ncbi:hypothetical protein CIG75_19510 [Tumebacillus algifaecis]|uniref:Uncharacterized protein n=1 Tax=Tumebacillus algifaecis TaxID=1214604 RepID=A0A223D648_9BACL|nr:hypothetical protein [Tumebacillus algifaecis]ASS76886.1 hypothetical protein CIG75_19510 [Tumebacillus algifaecis]